MVDGMEFPDWAALPGTLLPDGYEVEQVLRGAGSSATFRIRILGDRFTTAAGEFFAPGTVPAGQVDVWLAASAVRHKNVSQPLTAGTHGELAYYVEVQPDETLAAVTAERALTVDEAREVTRSLIDGLAHLHANGFAQGRLTPLSVAAIGDRICLRLDAVRFMNAPLAPGEEASAAGDVQALGNTIFAILTQRSESSAEAISKLPAPFDTVVSRCLEAKPENRPSLDEVRSLLKGITKPVAKAVEPAPAPDRIAAAVVPEPVTVAPIPVPAPASETAGPLAEPVRRLSESVPPRFETAWPIERAPSRKRGPLWFYVPIAAILIAAALLWALRPKPPAATPASGPAWPSHTVGPKGSTAPTTATTASVPPAASPIPAIPTPTHASASKHGDVWHVIAFTFDREADARKRAQAINEKHPALHADVFSPSGGSPYLVTLGGGMSREEAEQLRRRARASGMPHDTYIQNYQR